MSELSSFLSAIVENPYQDEPRLIYADWLEERGEPRGELIRVQCEIARSDVVSTELWRRERELIAEHGASWVAPLAGLRQPPKIEFERGLLKRWSSTPTELAAKKNGKRLQEFFAGFGLEGLLLRNPTKRIVSVAKCSLFDWVFSLDWRDCQLDDSAMHEWTHSSHLRHLRRLRLDKLRCSDAGLIALSQSPSLGRLEQLAIVAPVSGGDYTHVGVSSVVNDLPNLQQLQVIDAWKVNLQSFAEATQGSLGKLRELSLQANSLQGFFETVDLPNLVALDLDVLTDSQMTDAMLTALLENPSLANLTRIRMPKLDSVSTSVMSKLGARFDLTLHSTGWTQYAFVI